VVECKHYPAGVVGRPVVQKLHSAVLTENATRGMIITTGRFSADAEDRAQNLSGVHIQLVDEAKLAHLISITYSAGSIPLNLCGAFRTTPDADFWQTFARSVFSRRRYNKGGRHAAPVRVDVRRVTRYFAFYLAIFRAEGKLGSAAGTFRGDWEGRIWLRADGSEAAFGSLLGVHGLSLDLLAEVLKTVPGSTESPQLQPHQAVAEMREFVVNNCARYVSYVGRNNVSYRRKIAPARNKVDIDSLSLCYVPRQQFVLQIGDVTHEGVVEEQESPPGFHVKCRSLSECNVCGAVTTAAAQILCSICHLPAHRWSLFFPDSFECRDCGGLVCRKHTVRNGKGRVCVRCDATGRTLPPRWLPHLLFGAAFSVLSAVTVALFLGSRFAPVAAAAGVAVVIASWVPMLCMLWLPAVRRRNGDLFYKKE
jgi:hypothetical protein